MIIHLIDRFGYCEEHSSLKSIKTEVFKINVYTKINAEISFKNHETISVKYSSGWPYLEQVLLYSKKEKPLEVEDLSRKVS